ncbi:MAG: M28 family peptidase [Acidobacteria bacterium]|nr:M28 family peptidase [Acidobacteriota bacterium]
MRRKMQLTVVGLVMLGTFGLVYGLALAPQQQAPRQEWWRQAEAMPTFQRSAGGWDSNQAPFFPPDWAYPRFALPPEDAAYGKLDARRTKDRIRSIAAISLKSKADGNQYWGRITGTPYDKQTTDWVAEQLRQIGVEQVRIQEFPLPTQWYPASWQVTLTGGGKTVPLGTAYPWWGSETANNIELEPVWVGLGTEADFQGRNVNGKAVLVHSILSPGGLNNSASWSGAIDRAREKGAAAVFMVLGIPGNYQAHPTGKEPPPWKGLTFSLGMGDGSAVREMIEKNQAPKIRIRLAVEGRDNLKTASVWGVLPGTTDENILVMAHTETFFQGALDNASGVATMLEIAQYYAGVPRAQRRRSITFLTTSAHHAPGPQAGIEWVRQNMDSFFAKTAVIVNCEHVSQTQTYLVGPNLVASTALGAGRWYMQGSDELKDIITKAFRTYGVMTFSRPATGSGGELGPLRGKAPGFHVLRDVFYHTELDIPELVPEAGLESMLRAYVKIMDEVNKLDLSKLRVNMGGTQ